MHRWFSTLCFSVVALTAQQAVAGCSKDTDCKGDRICVAGACTAPSAAPAPAPAAAPTPPPAAVTLTEPMIAEIYMKGDVTSALNEARAAGLGDLVARLTAVSQAYGAAYAAQQARNVDEAIRQYELVVQYDRAIATRDNAYSSAARNALASLYAEKSRMPAAAPAQPYAAPPAAAQPAYAPPMVAAPTAAAPADRTVTFSGRALEYVVEGQRCTAPCSMTLSAGVHTMEVRGLGRYRLAVNTDVTRVEARKGSAALAVVSGLMLAASPFLFWAGVVTPPDCNSSGHCDEGKKILAYVSGSLFLVLGLVGLPIGIADAVRTNVTVNGAQTYRASREVKFTPLLAFTGNGGYLGGQLSF